MNTSDKTDVLSRYKQMNEDKKHTLNPREIQLQNKIDAIQNNPHLSEQNKAERMRQLWAKSKKKVYYVRQKSPDLKTTSE